MSIEGYTFKTPMKFSHLYKDIASELDKNPNRNMVRLELNKIIRRINSELGVFRKLVGVTSGAMITDWQNLDTYDWEDIEEYNWNTWGRFNSNWIWDVAEKKLLLADEVLRVRRIIIDDEEWTHKSFEYVKDSNNSTKHIYHQVGRYVYFPIDLDSTTQEVKMEIIKRFGMYIDTDEIDLPEDFRPLLIAGVLCSLFNKKYGYNDKDIYQMQKNIYEQEFYEIRETYNLIESPSYLEAKYTF